MPVDLPAIRAVLARTPDTLRTWLAELPDERLRQNEGPDSWSPFDVLGHLAHGERTDWIPRVRTVLEHGTGKTFEPFDRFAQMDAPADETVASRLDTFAALRAENLAALDALAITPEQFALQGRHPEFGEVTLGQLLSTWAVHDLGHIAQIARVLAKGWREDVGPWQAYLPVVGG